MGKVTRRVVCLLLSVVLVAGVAPAAAAAESGLEGRAVTAAQELPTLASPPPAPSAPVARSVGHPAEAPEFPEPGSTVVVVAHASQGDSAESGWVVSVRAVDPEAVGEVLTVTVLDRAATAAAEVQGVAFDIDAEPETAGRVEITLDYTAFRHAYGGG